MSTFETEIGGNGSAGISAVVKWFNTAKGFGFVKPADGTPDAFLHASVLEQAGYRSLEDGATITCEITQGPRGPMVQSIFTVSSPDPGAVPPDAEVVEGSVKFFDANRGYGFVVPDSGGQDVFLPASVVERAGLMTLDSDQRVRLTKRDGKKGPLAATIELL